MKSEVRKSAQLIASNKMDLLNQNHKKDQQVMSGNQFDEYISQFNEDVVNNELFYQNISATYRGTNNIGDFAKVIMARNQFKESIEAKNKFIKNIKLIGGVTGGQRFLLA